MRDQRVLKVRRVLTNRFLELLKELMRFRLLISSNITLHCCQRRENRRIAAGSVCGIGHGVTEGQRREASSLVIRGQPSLLSSGGGEIDADRTTG